MDFKLKNQSALANLTSPAHRQALRNDFIQQRMKHAYQKVVTQSTLTQIPQPPFFQNNDFQTRKRQFFQAIQQDLSESSIFVNPHLNSTRPSPPAPIRPPYQKDPMNWTLDAHKPVQKAAGQSDLRVQQQIRPFNFPDFSKNNHIKVSPKHNQRQQNKSQHDQYLQQYQLFQNQMMQQFHQQFYQQQFQQYQQNLGQPSSKPQFQEHMYISHMKDRRDQWMPERRAQNNQSSRRQQMRVQVDQSRAERRGWRGERREQRNQVQSGRESPQRRPKKVEERRFPMKQVSPDKRPPSNNVFNYQNQKLSNSLDLKKPYIVCYDSAEEQWPRKQPFQRNLRNSLEPERRTASFLRRDSQDRQINVWDSTHSQQYSRRGDKSNYDPITIKDPKNQSQAFKPSSKNCLNCGWLIGSLGRCYNCSRSNYQGAEYRSKSKESEDRGKSKGPKLKVKRYGPKSPWQQLYEKRQNQQLNY